MKTKIDKIFKALNGQGDISALFVADLIRDIRENETDGSGTLSDEAGEIITGSLVELKNWADFALKELGYEKSATAKDDEEYQAELGSGKHDGNPPEQGEGICPKCGGELELEEEESDGDGGGRAAWTCPECGAEGVQVREIICTGHESIKTPEDFDAIAKAALYPDGPRTMYADEAGTVEYKAIGAGTGKWGPQIDRHEAALMFEKYGDMPGVTIYCREASDTPDKWAGVEAGDLEDGELPEGWNTLEVYTEDGPNTFRR